MRGIWSGAQRWLVQLQPSVSQGAAAGSPIGGWFNGGEMIFQPKNAAAFGIVVGTPGWISKLLNR